jgi:hypothetical protein
MTTVYCGATEDALITGYCYYPQYEWARFYFQTLATYIGIEPRHEVQLSQKMELVFEDNLYVSPQVIAKWLLAETEIREDGTSRIPSLPIFIGDTDQGEKWIIAGLGEVHTLSEGVYRFVMKGIESTDGQMVKMIPSSSYRDWAIVIELWPISDGTWVQGKCIGLLRDYLSSVRAALITTFGKPIVGHTAGKPGLLPMVGQALDTSLELENRRLTMNEIDRWQAEATEYLQQSWRVDLKQFASGTWPGSLDAFRGALMAFGLRAKDDEFGRHSIRFWILPNQVHPISGETCWMVGMSGCNRKSLYTVKNEEGYLEAEGGEPYAEIRVREIAQGYRVDLLVQSDVHEEAIAEYLDKLYQALQRDGLRTTYSKNGLQPKQATQQILPVLDSTEVVDGKGGRPGLSGKELVYRLAKAQEAEEIRARDPRKTWKEIAREIKWRHGSDKAGIKLLEDARKRLKEHELLGPEWRLQQVEEYRRKEKRET